MITSLSTNLFSQWTGARRGVCAGFNLYSGEPLRWLDVSTLVGHSVGSAAGPLPRLGAICLLMGHPRAGGQALARVLDFKLCTPWNMRSPFAASSVLPGTTGRRATRSAATTARTQPSPADRVRCRRPHTVAELSAEPIWRAQVFSGTTGDRVPYMVGGTSVQA